VQKVGEEIANEIAASWMGAPAKAEAKPAAKSEGEQERRRAIAKRDRLEEAWRESVDRVEELGGDVETEGYFGYDDGSDDEEYDVEPVEHDDVPAAQAAYDAEHGYAAASNPLTEAALAAMDPAQRAYFEGS
jgi:hypothetical protein